jgi:myo-inositol 2-dehydrogenase/D-chiro-inositol 1-dehydrogenase
VALCDVDREIAEKARKDFGGKADLYDDHRKMLERKDLDAVTIGAPDHWHTAMVIDAVRAGKDVYVEKPLTLTIDEGKLLCRVVKETGRVVQVGSWQRSDHQSRLACEMVHKGRIGKLQRIEIVLDKNVQGGPFKVEDPPLHLNWDRWQGQTPAVPYIKERRHFTFRWWYEYSGGQMTDWGAHHLDIAQWGAGLQHTGPVTIEGKARFPQVPNGYNVATDFTATLTYANGVALSVTDTGKASVTFVGAEGRITVARGSLSSKPAELLKRSALAPPQYTLYAHDNPNRKPPTGKLHSIDNHMGNFVDCMKSRQRPISDVVSQHRSVTACHLANIAMRLGRALRWDPEKEVFIGDDEANRWLRRDQRKPYQNEA